MRNTNYFENDAQFIIYMQYLWMNEHLVQLLLQLVYFSSMKLKQEIILLGLKGRGRGLKLKFCFRRMLLDMYFASKSCNSNQLVNDSGSWGIFDIDLAAVILEASSAHIGTLPVHNLKFYLREILLHLCLKHIKQQPVPQI